MGFLDKAKSMMPGARRKAGDLANQHGEKVDGAIDKTAGFVDDKTGGKHSDKIDGAADKAKDAVDKLGGEADGPKS